MSHLLFMTLKRIYAQSVTLQSSLPPSLHVPIWGMASGNTSQRFKPTSHAKSELDLGAHLEGSTGQKITG
jgi:hypothetical protein